MENNRFSEMDVAKNVAVFESEFRKLMTEFKDATGMEVFSVDIWRWRNVEKCANGEIPTDVRILIRKPPTDSYSRL